MENATYDIIVIGAGPGGISMAAEAVSAGVPAERVLLLEKAAEHSFSIKKYYPDKKLVTANYKGFEAVCLGVLCIPDLSKADTITYLDAAIEAYNLQARYNEAVYKIHKHFPNGGFTVFSDKGEYNAKVVAIAIGILGKPNKPDYPIPPALKNRAVFDVTSFPITNSRVLVVGGGDSASEYAQYLVQEGNTVSFSYRRTELTRMNDLNRQSLLALAERSSVELLLGSNISGLRESGGLPVANFNALGEREFDYIVYALGGSTPANFLKLIGIEFNGDDPILCDNYETSVPGLFLIGDLSAGTKGGSIIWAFNSAKRAMQQAVKNYLG